MLTQNCMALYSLWRVTDFLVILITDHTHYCQCPTVPVTLASSQLTRAWKASLAATKSVSQFTSISTPSREPAGGSCANWPLLRFSLSQHQQALYLGRQQGCCDGDGGQSKRPVPNFQGLNIWGTPAKITEKNRL